MAGWVAGWNVHGCWGWVQFSLFPGTRILAVYDGSGGLAAVSMNRWGLLAVLFDRPVGSLGVGSVAPTLLG